MARRRKWINLKKLDRYKFKQWFENSTILLHQKKKEFVILLESENITMEQLQEVNFEWYSYLYKIYNPPTTRESKKRVYLEDIPFYSPTLYKSHKKVFDKILFKEELLKEKFTKYTIPFKMREMSYTDILSTEVGSKFLDRATTKGMFYYELPKGYKWFELWVEKGNVYSTDKINLPKTRLKKLPNNMVFFGFKLKTKTMFLTYYSREESLKKSEKVKVVKRLQMLNMNLRERDILDNNVEGTFIWDIDDIPQSVTKNDVLLVIPNESLFESIVMKGER